VCSTPLIRVGKQKERIQMNAEHDRITIGLSRKSHWLSIVEYKFDGYHTKELALVVHSPRSFLGVSLVPLNEWYDMSEYGEETIINLLLGKETEAVILHKAISRAETYMSFFDGFEIVTEPSED